MKQPQEIEVWYILPAIRREFARIMIEDHGLSQKDTAKILGITDSAVSQYVKSKRAGEVDFSKTIINSLKESVKIVIDDKNKMIPQMQKICEMLKEDLTLCKLHKSKSNGVPAGCSCCIKPSKKI